MTLECLKCWFEATPIAGSASGYYLMRERCNDLLVCRTMCLTRKPTWIRKLQLIIHWFKTRVRRRLNLSRASNVHSDGLNLAEDDDFEDLNIDLDVGSKCPKHTSMPIHSYVKSNKVLLCSKCIMENDYDRSRFKAITQIVKEIRGSMNSHKLKLNQNLLQLKKF